MQFLCILRINLILLGYIIINSAKRLCAFAFCSAFNSLIFKNSEFKI